MERAPDRRDRNVVLYVRGSSMNHDRERAVVEVLESLSSEGIIDGVEVQTWPEKVSLQRAGGGRGDLIETFEAFESWAEDHGASIRPPFELKHHESAITQERDDVLVTPMLFLAVYDDGELVDLYPHERGEAVTTVDQWLARFAEADADAWSEEEAPSKEDRPQTVGTGTGSR